MMDQSVETAGVRATVIRVCNPLEQPGGFLASMDNDKLPKEILGRETNRQICLANIKLKAGHDYSVLVSDTIEQGWRFDHP